MKLKFRHQRFQADAARAVCGVFNGQPYLSSSYMMDRGSMSGYQITTTDEQDFTGFGNARLVPELGDERILQQIQAQQRAQLIEPSPTFEGRFIYNSTQLTEPSMKGQLGANAMAAKKHLYDYLIYDSANERTFAEQIDTASEVAVYAKLPSGFFISTPVGKYNPDWAVAFYEGAVKHIYFVAETKGSLSSLQLRAIEEAKIHCAREHFKAISSDSIVYDVVDSYASLTEKVMR